jgi:hypothetical protein
LAAKASSLASMTSCGTFFESPETSGRINMMFVRQALEHLADAQQVRAANQLLSETKSILSRGVDPHSGQRLHKLFEKILQV